jgi:hypothetical protein
MLIMIALSFSNDCKIFGLETLYKDSYVYFCI